MYGCLPDPEDSPPGRVSYTGCSVFLSASDNSGTDKGDCCKQSGESWDCVRPSKLSLGVTLSSCIIYIVQGVTQIVTVEV